MSDELASKIIPSLIQFNLTKESNHYLGTIDPLDEIALQITGPQDDMLSSWKPAVLERVFGRKPILNALLKLCCSHRGVPSGGFL